MDRKIEDRFPIGSIVIYPYRVDYDDWDFSHPKSWAMAIVAEKRKEGIKIINIKDPVCFGWVFFDEKKDRVVCVNNVIPLKEWDFRGKLE